MCLCFPHVSDSGEANLALLDVNVPNIRQLGGCSLTDWLTARPVLTGQANIPPTHEHIYLSVIDS